MRISHHFAPLRTLREIDWVAIVYAALLSFACLFRGAVDDACIAVILLCSLPILLIALRNTHTIHSEFIWLGMVLVSAFILVLVLQYNSGAHTPESGMLYDRSAAMRGIGRLLFFIITASIALIIGSHESSARLFLRALLISGVACLTVTFFLARADMMFANLPQVYRHGFVNSNNAATYLGMILLLSIAQMVRFMKQPKKSMARLLLDFIDELNLSVIIKWGFLLFSLLISLAGLLMTASRGGILFSLICSAALVFILVLKSDLHSTARKLTIAAAITLMGMMLMWGFTYYGQNVANKFDTDGTSANSRMEIAEAVMPMIGDHPWLGSGLGSFPGAFQAYRPASISADGIIDKAHNSYLEFAAEMGVPLLLLLMLVLGRIGFLLLRGVRTRKERYTISALGLAVWVLVAMHSLIDFPLQIPGLAAMWIAIIVVCVCQTDARYYQPMPVSSSDRKRVRIRKRRTAIQR